VLVRELHGTFPIAAGAGLKQCVVQGSIFQHTRLVLVSGFFAFEVVIVIVHLRLL
jgi:hypothetical protein